MTRRLFVVSGPSGVGKSTILRAVVASDPALQFAVSHTTRPCRPGEEDGRDYHFVDEGTFRRMVAAGAFVEFAEVHGHRYGTSHRALGGTDSGDLLIEVDVQGAASLRSRERVVTIFIAPPSITDLDARLRQRGRDSVEAIQGRLGAAPGEMDKRSCYDHVVVNRNLDETVAEVRRIIAGARKRCTGNGRQAPGAGPSGTAGA